MKTTNNKIELALFLLASIFSIAAIGVKYVTVLNVAQNEPAYTYDHSNPIEEQDADGTCNIYYSPIK